MSAAVATREARALVWARTGIIVAFIGSFVRPGFVQLGMLLLIVGLLRLPTLGARLRRVLLEPLPRAALLLLFVLALATAWSSAPWSLRLGELWHWRTLLLLVLCLAVFDSREWKVWLVVAIVVAALLGSAAAWITWALDFRVFKIHPAGTVLRDGVTQGMTFAVAAYLAAIVALNEDWLDRRLRWLLLVAAALLVASLMFVTAGRSAQLALLIMLAFSVLALLRGAARVVILVALPLGFAAAILIAPMATERFERGWIEYQQQDQLDDVTSVGMRTVIWRLSAQLIQERPLLGWGTGGFRSAYAQRAAATQTGWRATPVDEPHNQYLSIQAQAGVLGTLAFAWFLIAAWRHPAPRPYRICALAILAAWVATSLLNSHFESFTEGHMIAILLGCLLAEEDPATGQASAPATAAATAS
jgi:O-antigen ligase